LSPTSQRRNLTPAGQGRPQRRQTNCRIERFVCQSMTVSTLSDPWHFQQRFMDCCSRASIGHSFLYVTNRLLTNAAVIPLVALPAIPWKVPENTLTKIHAAMPRYAIAVIGRSTLGTVPRHTMTRQQLIRQDHSPGRRQSCLLTIGHGACRRYTHVSMGHNGKKLPIVISLSWRTL